MLEVTRLTRFYGDFKAVDEVNFKIDHGEIVGLLGHNGAGKTTIMKMLSGYLEPNDGRITIDDIDLQIDPKKAQREIGYLPENLPIYPEMTVADYLDYVGDIKGLAAEDKVREIRRVIRETSLVDKLLSPIATLSRGYKQRVGVAQAILGQPKILILDEPTNGLDPSQTEQMRRLIKALANKATVILSTHIMQEVDAICDRALIVRHGRLAVDAGLEELRRGNTLLLTASADKTAVGAALSSLKNIVIADYLPSQDTPGEQQTHNYRLRIENSANPEKLVAETTRLLVQAGIDIYGISQEKRDLETLFREVNTAPAQTSAEETKNAA
ncbi:ABC transporter ATP-binding protein [Porticoccus sp.]|uniref:ABC transporter ATP-binding protein n=1 Tax=Porticoccus sp. TaxID=2024853 RepID=UPI003F6959A9